VFVLLLENKTHSHSVRGAEASGLVVNKGHALVCYAFFLAGSLAFGAVIASICGPKLHPARRPPGIAANRVARLRFDGRMADYINMLSNAASEWDENIFVSRANGIESKLSTVTS
jgi:hypothetical protein